jgi:hypothetical protein
MDQWQLGVRKTLQCLVKPPCGSSMPILQMIKDWGGGSVFGDQIIITPHLPRTAAETVGVLGAGYYISFTPQDWDNPAQKPLSMILADEVLLHELVHAARYLYGLQAGDLGKAGFSPPPRLDQRYDNLEEFCAMVIMNIYRSENVRLNLHRDHADPTNTLPDDLRNPAKFVELWHGPLWLLQGQFYRSHVFDRIAVVQCKFNPFAELQRLQLANASG